MIVYIKEKLKKLTALDRNSDKHGKYTSHAMTSDIMDGTHDWMK